MSSPAQADLFSLPTNAAPTHGPRVGVTGTMLGDLWLRLFCVALVGYALMGKGWAYVGVPPVFIGEVILLAGILALLAARRWQGVLNLSLTWILLALALWGLART